MTAVAIERSPALQQSSYEVIVIALCGTQRALAAKEAELEAVRAGAAAEASLAADGLRQVLLPGSLSVVEVLLRSRPAARRARLCSEGPVMPEAEARAKAAEESAAELRTAAEEAEVELIGVREESHGALQAADSRRVALCMCTKSMLTPHSWHLHAMHVASFWACLRHSVTGTLAHHVSVTQPLLL